MKAAAAAARECRVSSSKSEDDSATSIDVLRYLVTANADKQPFSDSLDRTAVGKEFSVLGFVC
jgi:hypothetical protein